MSGLLPDKARVLLARYREDSAYRKLIRSSFTSLLIRIVGVTTGFLATLITTRLFGAEALGIVSICLAILSLAAVFGKLGMDIALMRYIAEFNAVKNISAIKSVYLKAMRFILPATILIALFLFLFSDMIADRIFNKPSLGDILRINSFIIIPLVLMLVNSECLRGMEKIRAYTFFQTASVSLLVSLLLPLAYFFNQQKDVPVIIQFSCITLSSLFSVWIWFNVLKWKQTKPASQVKSLKLARTSTPMFVTTIMQLVMSWAGTLILAANYSESQVGVYSAIVRISVFTNMTVLAINSMASPNIASAYSGGNLEDMKSISRESARLIFLSSIPLFLPLIIFPSFVLSIFGNEFTGHEQDLVLMLIGQLVVVFSGLPSQILNMTDKEKHLRNNAIIATIINVAACLLLIPGHGISGAVIAQVAGMVSWNLLCILSVRKIYRFNSFFTFTK